MTLTLYTAHVLVVARHSPLLMDDQLHFWLANVLGAIVVATLWRTLIGRGPLEAVMARADKEARNLFGGRGAQAVDRDPRPAGPVA
jgi:hypothetical protein